MTRDELYAEAKRLNIAGRSKMSKEELEKAIADPKDTPTDVQTHESVTTNAALAVGDERMNAHRRAKARKFVSAYSRRIVTHMPNSERVIKYVKERTGVGQLFTAKLTPKQMRRVRKNANKHGEGFIYSTGFNGKPGFINGYSLLARTPEGLGIFYRFSK